MRRNRVDEGAVLLQTVIEVRAGGETRHPHAADQFTLMDVLPGANGDGRQVQVLGFEPVGVAQVHHASGSAARARRHDDAVGHRDHGRANRRPVVDAEMRAHLAQDRMQPRAGESGRHDRLKLQRRREEEAFHRDAALVEVSGRAVLGREAHGANAPAVVHELRGEDRPVPAEGMVCAVLLFDGELELIAGLQLGVEIDLAAEDLCERERQLDRLAGRVHRRHERGRGAIDAAAHHVEAAGLRNGHHAGVQLGALNVRHEQKAIGVDFVLKLPQRAVERPFDPVRMSRANLARVEYRGGLGDDFRDLVDSETLRAQQRCERRPGGHARRHDRRVARQRDVGGGALRDAHRLLARAARRQQSGSRHGAHDQ